MNRERFGRGLLSTGFRFSPVELEVGKEAVALMMVMVGGGGGRLIFVPLRQVETSVQSSLT